MLRDAETDLTAFAYFPTEHCKKIWSNNPTERVNTKIKRRTDLVQVFPHHASVTRLVSALLLEQHEERQYAQRRYLSNISIRRPASLLRQNPKQAAITTA